MSFLMYFNFLCNKNFEIWLIFLKLEFLCIVWKHLLLKIDPNFRSITSHHQTNQQTFPSVKVKRNIIYPYFWIFFLTDTKNYHNKRNKVIFHTDTQWINKQTKIYSYFTRIIWIKQSASSFVSALVTDFTSFFIRFFLPLLPRLCFSTDL